METIVVILIVALAVWYLYRTFSKSFKGGQSSCGCGGCDGCSNAPQGDNKKAASKEGAKLSCFIVGAVLLSLLLS
jgi:hypothetical protein